MAIPQPFLQELLARVDVVEVVGRHVQLKKGGANFMGLCPFHAEKSPSFTVSPTKQFYHCFGCGKHGDAIGFLMEHSGLSFIEAVKDLAQGVGLQVPEDDRSPQEREQAAQARARQATLTDVLEKATQAYRKHLRDSPQAVAYLKGRGLSGEVARAFGLGYAPDGWRSLASVFPDYQDPLLVESGLVILQNETGAEEKRYDRFRDRIMFPIRNVKGECIGFGGRVLGEGSPKYLNSPETPVFSKGRELYGLYEARHALRDAGYVLVTEGYMDVVALAQLGFPQAVATLGTACTPEHVQKLFRFTDSVVFSFDGDAAGRRAARKALEGALPHATDVRRVKFLFLPPEHDPDSFIRAHGSDAFARLVADAMPLSRFLVESARESCDLATAEGRALMASQAKPLWSALPEGVLKTQLLGELADLAQIGAPELQQLWGNTGGRGERGARASASSARPARAGYPARESSGLPPRTDRSSRRMAQILSREDRAVQIFFVDMQLWAQLSASQHTLLCELPAPHGPLLAWLDQQWHEHGAQPLSALREGLQDEALAAALQRLMGLLPPLVDNDPSELQSILVELEKQDIARQLTALTPQAGRDPSVFEQIRRLNERLRTLKT
ncbi:MAG: DNA primase [Limnohabitans sp.]|nr:DNA primase [Limnohabitans sp.]